MNALKEAISQSKLTRIEIAQKARISTKSLKRYTEGDRNPDVYTAQILADILDKPIDQLWQTK